ncbi:DinB family protein [Paeniglutamicibacter sp. ABSL32-1]|uniref:DinB family protein n=1 Tax=Paeniglutamicibacter quisquiliarum TaxID=2849498 RepID=UPI001C2DDEAC|nr:DinB family protein [Paeniglutamicibacter quisquiliarum]MBV1779041.1 DinB family protein [Paeniglutamicibacter quisquiliarum]
MNDQPTPDTKDWTVVLSEPCGECGIDVRALNPAQVAALLRESVPHYTRALAAPDAGVRNDPGVWSTHEYCAHVAEMLQVMNARLALMLESDAPTFASWDQNEAAVRADYAAIPAAEVARRLEESAASFADALEALTDAQLPRMGTRSNGAVFTTATLAQYAWHDAAHHLHHDLGVGRPR